MSKLEELQAELKLAEERYQRLNATQQALKILANGG